MFDMGQDPPMDPRMLLLLQAALARQQGGYGLEGEGAPPTGPPMTQPGPPFLGNPGRFGPMGGGGPGFLGPPVQQFPPQGSVPFDRYAAERGRQAQQPPPMDPQRALAVQEMGKYLTAWGKLHQQRDALERSIHDARRPTGAQP